MQDEYSSSIICPSCSTDFPDDYQIIDDKFVRCSNCQVVSLYSDVIEFSDKKLMSVFLNDLDDRLKKIQM